MFNYDIAYSQYNIKTCTVHSILMAITLYCWHFLVIMTSHHSMLSQCHHNHTKYVELFNQAI